MDLNAAEVLERMAQAYAGCRSYRDSGVVTTVFDTGGRRRTQRRPFSTAFVRRHGFRFEFRSRSGEEEWDQYAIWLEEGQARTWWSLMTQDRAPGTLSHAVAGATGVSGGAAHTVPGMLLPGDIGGWKLHQLASPVLGAVAQVDGAWCYTVSGATRLGNRALLVDQSTFMLRRIEEAPRDLNTTSTMLAAARAQLPEQVRAKLEHIHSQPLAEKCSAHSRVDYTPELNAEVTPAELVFVPPPA